MVFKSYLIGLLCVLAPLAHLWSELSEDTLYLTWQQDPSQTITAQWVSNKNDAESSIYYQVKGTNEEWIKIEGRTFLFPSADAYFIHRVEITELAPDTVYAFRFNTINQEYCFKTAPLNLDQSVRIVIGGDMYHDDIEFVRQTCRQAAKTNPLFAVIGGDVAYAVASNHSKTQQIERWIEWLKVWHQTMVTPGGCLIPVIAAIGNHDLLGGYGQHPEQAKVFSSLFPMPGKRIYNVLDFSSYLSFFLLDSGHANPIKGAQSNWLRHALENRSEVTYRLAIYHVPAYTSIRNFQNSISSSIRKNWVPLFEKNKVQFVFENHDHTYKRTHPLLKNKINSNGIVYIGDGAWGIEKPRVSLKKNLPFYLAKLISTRHFILATLTKQDVSIMCIDDQGEMLDYYKKTIEVPQDVPNISSKMKNSLSSSKNSRDKNKDKNE